MNCDLCLQHVGAVRTCGRERMTCPRREGGHGLAQGRCWDTRTGDQTNRTITIATSTVSTLGQALIPTVGTTGTAMLPGSTSSAKSRSVDRRRQGWGENVSGEEDVCGVWGVV